MLRWKRGRELVHCLYKKLQTSRPKFTKISTNKEKLWFTKLVVYKNFQYCRNCSSELEVRNLYLHQTIHGSCTTSLNKHGGSVRATLFFQACQLTCRNSLRLSSRLRNGTMIASLCPSPRFGGGRVGAGSVVAAWDVDGFGTAGFAEVVRRVVSSRSSARDDVVEDSWSLWLCTTPSHSLFPDCERTSWNWPAYCWSVSFDSRDTRCLTVSNLYVDTTTIKAITEAARTRTPRRRSIMAPTYLDLLGRPRSLREEALDMSLCGIWMEANNLLSCQLANSSRRVMASMNLLFEFSMTTSRSKSSARPRAMPHPALEDELEPRHFYSMHSRRGVTLGADEAKMYNCLIFRGRVGPNARLTASMQWMHAKIDTRLECLLTSTSSRSHKRAQAQTKQEKERKRNVSLFIYWAYVEKACSERPI